MILKNSLRYVVLDVETTGLDKKRDEITQIAFTEYDAKGVLVQEFSSYIKPSTKRDVEDVVKMITGISAETLANAPSREEIHDTVVSFFSPHSVLIGHSVGFDIAFLQRHLSTAQQPIQEFQKGIHYHTIIDTLPLAQSLIPYLPSYALEIIIQNVFPPRLQQNVPEKTPSHTDTGNNKPQTAGKTTQPTLGTIPTPTEGEKFHDAATDTRMTGKLFFALTARLENIYASFPYLQEIGKRTANGIAMCFEYSTQEQFLLKEIPLMSVEATEKKQKVVLPPLPTGTRYAGDTSLGTTLSHIDINSEYISFSQHPKVQLAQKTYNTQGAYPVLHEQVSFSSDLLHAFFTKKSFEDREFLCASKYVLQSQQDHSSFHAVTPKEHLFLQACRIITNRTMRKRLFTHHALFDAIVEGVIPSNAHIILFDKERLFDSRKKRKFKAYDLYTYYTQIEATLYKYTLLQQDNPAVHTQPLEKLFSSIGILLGVFGGEVEKFFKDMQVEKATIDNFFTNTYFTKTQQLLGSAKESLDACHAHCKPEDIIMLDKERAKIETILNNPLCLQHKRSNYQNRFTIEPVDSFVEWADITNFFETYQLTIVSVLDQSLNSLDFLPHDLLPTTIKKRKDITLTNTPKLFLIAPSKGAAQQLLLTLHKSNEYQDVFLAAEQVTGGAGKIMQQALGKQSYILIGSYNFCIQCIANALKFDSIGALDIIHKEGLNPFNDLSFYTGEKIYISSENNATEGA